MDFGLSRSLGVLLVDAQTSFFEQMHGRREPVEARIARLLRLADWLELPTLVTLERPVAEKGGLPPALDAAVPPHAVRVEKSMFDCMAEPAAREVLEAMNRPVIAVAGAETDVCVLLSVLSLLDAGHEVRIIEDALFSSEADPSPALRRMYAAGAVPCTLKTLAYELTQTVDRSAWPARWRERLAERPDLFPPPEDLA